MTLPPRALEPGSIVFGCRIERQLGRGAMGVVYLAQTAEGKRVAVKVLTGGSAADASRRERFRHEAQIAQRLDHPGIVKLLSAQLEGEYPCFIMEYVEGRSLASVFSDPNQGMVEKLRLMVQVCRAVHAAHAQGVIHRDLKPENIVVTPDRVAKVLDFGVAKDLSRNTQLTETGTTVGSPAYMAPEQVQGKAVTARTDVYGLGVLLYELLTGDVPFRGATVVEYFQAILSTKPEPPSRLGVASTFDPVCLRALAKQPEQRYPSAVELAEAIEQRLEGPIHASPGGSSGTTLAVGMAGGLLLGVAGVLLVQTLMTSTPQMPAEVPPTDPPVDAPPVDPPPVDPPVELPPVDPPVELSVDLAPIDPLPVDPSEARQEADAWVVKGRQLAMSGDAEGALAAFDKAIALDVTNHGAWLSRAHVLEKLSRFKEAVEAFERAIAQKETSGLWAELADARRQAGDIQGALRAFDRCIELDPNNGPMLNYRANLRFQVGRYDDAISDYTRSLRRRPNDRMTLFNRGNARLKSGDAEGAIVDYDTAMLSRGPVRLGDIHYARGYAHKATGNKAAAIADFEECLRLRPSPKVEQRVREELEALR